MSHESSDAAPNAHAPGLEAQHAHGGGNFWILALGSLGVVFGDIGTSPLYALQTALGQFKDGGLGPGEVIGSVSLIVWVTGVIYWVGSFKIELGVLRTYILLIAAVSVVATVGAANVF